MGVRTVIRGGVDRFLGKGIELPLGAELLRFESEDELKLYLKTKASVSAETLGTLKEMSPQRLERHLKRNERICRHVLGLLLQVVEHATPVDMLWRELDISELPDEQQWPALLFAVSSSHDLSESLKRECIERFVEFLRARKALLLKLIELSGTASLKRHQDTAEFEVADRRTPGGGEVQGDLNGAAMTRRCDYQRIPEGENVVLELKEGERVNVYLSRWKISLERLAGGMYVNENGNAVPLRKGANSVGRSAGCDVALANAPLDVSRKHLAIDWTDGGNVRLRDLSSKGTWVPGELLSAAGSETITGTTA